MLLFFIQVYRELFDKVIFSIHGFKETEMHKTDLDSSKVWVSTGRY